MSELSSRSLRAGMVGVGMIFDETYRPFFERVHREQLFDRRFGVVDVPLIGIASRTGSRASEYRKAAGKSIHDFESFSGDSAVDRLIAAKVDFACVATP